MEASAAEATEHAATCASPVWTVRVPIITATRPRAEHPGIAGTHAPALLATRIRIGLMVEGARLDDVRLHSLPQLSGGSSCRNVQKLTHGRRCSLAKCGASAYRTSVEAQPLLRTTSCMPGHGSVWPLNLQTTHEITARIQIDQASGRGPAYLHVHALDLGFQALGFEARL